MSLTLSTQDKVDIRRHMGYGFLGAGQPGLMYFRYFPHYQTMEWRMDNLQDEEITVLQDTYLPVLNQLEMQTAGAGDGADNDTLDTDRAAVWFHNKDEVTDRAALYTYYRKMLCNVMQLPPGPFFELGGSTIRMMV